MSKPDTGDPAAATGFSMCGEEHTGDSSYATQPLPALETLLRSSVLQEYGLEPICSSRFIPGMGSKEGPDELLFVGEHEDLCKEIMSGYTEVIRSDGGHQTSLRYPFVWPTHSEHYFSHLPQGIDIKVFEAPDEILSHFVVDKDTQSWWIMVNSATAIDSSQPFVMFYAVVDRRMAYMVANALLLGLREFFGTRPPSGDAMAMNEAFVPAFLRLGSNPPLPSSSSEPDPDTPTGALWSG